MKTNAFFILFLICIGLSYKFEERPPIKKEQCPVEIQEIKYDLVFFIKLEGVHKYKPKVEELNIFSKKLVALLDEIKEPNKLLLDIIENPKKESPYVVKYDENIKPDDIEAIKHYKILVQFEEKYQPTIDFDGKFFLQFFERDVNKFLSSLEKINTLIDNLKQYTIDDIQHELVQLQRDFKTCTGNQFHLIQQSIKLQDVKNKKRRNHKKNKNNKKQNQQSLVQNLETQFIQWKFVEYEPVKKEECGQYMEEIEQDFLEFLKIQELVKYRRHKQAYTDSVNQLYEQKEDYVRLAKIISKAKHSLRFDNSMIIRGAFRYYLELGLDNQFKGYNKDYSLANDAIGYLDQTYNDLNDLKSTFDKPSTLLGVDLEAFEFFKQKNEILNNYLDKSFSYQDEEVYHELLQINKDYKICEGKKDYGEYIFKIQNEQQVNKKEQKKEYILDPPIQKQNCQKQLPDIKENILYYLKHNVVKQFGLLIPYYEKIMQDINNLQDNILTNNKQLNNFFKDLKLETTLIFIQQIQSNSNPDDLKVIKAYDNLNSLNNYLSINQNIFLAYLKKNYLEAVPFLKITESDFSTLNKQFNNLKTKIDYKKYQAQDIQKELQESLRDYTICTDKDFLEEYNLELQDRSQDNLSYSFYKDKNKFIKPVNGLIDQKSNLLQLSQDWKYEEYPPIQKHKCTDELPLINEDIRKFQKVLVLSRYKIENQKSYDILIEKVLKMKEEFLKQAKQGSDILYKLDFSSRLRMFNDYPKNQNNHINPEIFNCFDKIHEYINNLGNFDKQQSAAIWLYFYDESNFKIIQQSQLLLNDYLNGKFKYNDNDVEKELQQLYRDYQICAERSYFDQPLNNEDIEFDHDDDYRYDDGDDYLTIDHNIHQQTRIQGQKSRISNQHQHHKRGGKKKHQNFI